MASQWKSDWLALKELAKRVWSEIQNDDVFGQAAKLSFYFLLALLPALLFVTALLGYFAESVTLRRDLLLFLAQVTPRAASRLVVIALDDLNTRQGGGTVSFGILATLWAASSGMTAIVNGLNRAYEVTDQRPWWKNRLIALWLTLVLGVLVTAALVLLLAGVGIGELVADRLDLHEAFTVAWNILRWFVVLAFMLLALDLLYHFGPALKDRRWEWINPGAFVALTLWMVASQAFRLYLRFFHTYTAIRGALGAVMILMLWFYLGGAAILIGAEVNSAHENAAGKGG